jgi:SAM-dependent methyltransferase
MTPKSYKDNFFEYHLQDSISSAEEIIPLVLKFIQPTSVIDIGCGIGTWLTVWKKYGLKNIRGVDGAYIDENSLLIPIEEFKVFDLEQGYSSDEKYDLVTCLEVAEHISESSAKNLIHSLCKLSDVVLFSAAVPGQEGTLHINEQYPTYWINLFKQNEYIPIDCLRQTLWANKKVSFWYKQNIMFFVKQENISHYDKLKEEAQNTNIDFINIIHPELLDHKSWKVNKYENILNSPKNTLFYFIKRFLLRQPQE